LHLQIYDNFGDAGYSLTDYNQKWMTPNGLGEMAVEDTRRVPFTGIYTSVGDGELVADQLDSVRFGHGLFSLLDAFPFQHPEAPDLSVSIPVGDASGHGAAGRARLFGQGAGGSFRMFTTSTITGPTSTADIVSALAAARS